MSISIDDNSAVVNFLKSIFLLSIFFRAQLHPGNDSQTSHHHFSVSNSSSPSPPEIISHIRFNLFPDGGVARLRLFGSGAKQLVEGEEINLSGIKYGYLGNWIIWEWNNMGNMRMEEYGCNDRRSTLLPLFRFQQMIWWEKVWIFDYLFI